MAGYDIMDRILCGETERDRALDANKKKRCTLYTKRCEKDK